MSAKNLFVASLITALLAGCGGGAANQPPALSDGTYDDSSSLSSDYGSDLGTDPAADLGTDDTTVTDPDASTSPDATTSPDANITYTLQGTVKDASGKAIAGAKVSVTSSTVLTDANGVYTITGISDTKVYVDVTMDGYDKISQLPVTLNESTSTTTTKSFELAAKGSEESTSTAGLHHDLTFGATKLKSVTSMVVAEGNVYVLGVLDGLLFDSTAVVSFGEDGTVINDFKKVGFLKSLPKDSAYLAVNGESQIVVSNASTGYAFSTGGDFAATVSPVKTSVVKKVTDSENSITYEIDGATHVKVTDHGSTHSYPLSEVGYAKAIALDSNNQLLVLDSTNKTVHTFSYDDGE
jgi:hypothetical protein